METRRLYNVEVTPGVKVKIIDVQFIENEDGQVYCVPNSDKRVTVFGEGTYLVSGFEQCALSEADYVIQSYQCDTPYIFKGVVEKLKTREVVLSNGGRWDTAFNIKLEWVGKTIIRSVDDD